MMRADVPVNHFLSLLFGLTRIHKVVSNHVTDDHVSIFNAAAMSDRNQDCKFRSLGYFAAIATSYRDGPATDPGSVLDGIYHRGGVAGSADPHYDLFGLSKIFDLL